MGIMRSIVVAVAMAAVVAVRTELSIWRPAEVDDGPWIPAGFEAFEPAIRARYNNRQVVIDEEVVNCNKVADPQVPDSIPSWADATVEELRQQRVSEIIDQKTALPVGAFEKGDEIVMKKCSGSALQTVVTYVRPKRNGNPANPVKDVYFSCGDASVKHTIYLKETIELGKQGTDTQGVYRLMALDRNVVLDGGSRMRIMKVMRRTNVLAYGLTFKRGRTGNAYGLSLEGMPVIGYGGAGILAVIESAVTAYNCRFVRNRVEVAYARWGGGAAVKLESGAYGQMIGCDFEGNDAAVGGAIASSSAVVLQIKNSRFLRNVARGGMDDNGETRPEDKYNNPLKEKRVILVRGGALRIDSVSGSDEISEQHVLICGSEFTENRIEFKTADLVNKYGYTEDEWFYVRGAGAVAALWNAPFDMDDVTDNQYFASVKDCVFRNNYEAIEPEGDWLGRYVFESMGAGHFKMEGCEFKGSRVNSAVLKVDNSDRWINTTVDYDTILKDLKFADNAGVYNVEISAGKYTSSCNFRNVEGVPDGSGNCKDQLRAAADAGGNYSLTEGDAFDTYGPGSVGPSTPAPQTPVATPVPTRHPDFVSCKNLQGYAYCEKLKNQGECGKPEVASDCRMSCGMCEVCVDFNSGVCEDVARFDRCGAKIYKESCPFSCQGCNPTPSPTPSPTLPPTPGPDFIPCADLKSKSYCAARLDAGKCTKAWAAAECPMTCGKCPACVDFDAHYCSNVAAGGLCTKDIAANCPLACGVCIPPTPEPHFTPCEDLKSKSYCAARLDAGKCTKAWAAAECPLTCAQCPVCEDFDEAYCRALAAAGQCTREIATNCPSACGYCR